MPEIGLLVALGIGGIAILAATGNKTAYLNFGRAGGLRFGLGRLERTSMRNTRGLPFFNLGRRRR